MRRPLDLSVGQRLALGFGTAGLLLAAVLYLTLGSLEDISELRQRQAEVIAPRADAAGELEAAVLYRRIAARTYALAPGEERLAEHRRASAELRDTLARLAALPKEPDGQRIFAQVPDLVDRFAAATDSFVELAKAQGEAALLLEAEDRMRAAQVALLAPVHQLAALQRRKTTDTRNAIAAEQEKLKQALMLTGLLVIGLLALTALSTAKGVRNPTLALLRASRSLAQGDFGPAVALGEGAHGQAGSRDELRELSHGFALMATSLRNREARLRAAERFATAIGSSLEPGWLCEQGLKEVVTHVGGVLGAVYLLSPDGATLRRRASFGCGAGEQTLGLGEGIPGQAALGRTAVVVRHIPADSPFAVNFGFDKVPPRTVLAAPMWVQERAEGVLLVASLGELPDDAVAFVEQCARQLAVGVQNALSNRRVQQLAAELQHNNEQLQAQNEEIQAQQEEIQAQNEELQGQNEELQSQGEEVRVQADELRHAVETLTLSEERYRQLFSHLSEGFALHEMIYDAAGRPKDYRFLEVNHAFETMTGLERANTVGRTLLEVLPSSERFWIEKYGEVAMTGKPSRFENYSQAVGKYFEVIAFSPGKNRFATLFVDVTNQRQAEQSLRAADQRKSDFLAVLSHELRNPLTPIRHGLTILERAAPGSEQAQRAQAVIQRQTGHLARLIDDLLDVTRINRGKIQLQRTLVDLAELLRQSAEDSAALFQASGIDLAVEVPEGPLHVEGDPERLAQIMGNLLQNAAKFTPQGGRVNLALHKGPASGSVQVQVRDTGVGMSPEVLAHLFEPFVQGDGSLARTRGGLGLGLALVKGLVDLHGGRVRASSAGLGKGAEFTIELPSAEGPGAPAPAPSVNAAQTRRVLVVEDNKDAADTLREVLQFGGHLVKVAYDGREALTLARGWVPDLVLCDIGLPQMDGYEVAQAFRADQALAGVYLVALSGYAQPEDQRRAKEAGFDEHLPKPPELQTIEGLLSRVPARAAGPAA